MTRVESVESISGLDPHDGKAICIRIENGRIASITPTASNVDHWLSAGFIDLQVNGFNGYDLNSSSLDADEVVGLTVSLAGTGVTTFLPTLITAPEDRIIGALRAIAAARAKSSLAAHAIPFVHVEGPHISPVDGPRGVHPEQYVRPPDVEEFDRWQAASGKLVGMVTMSPHWNGALQYISELTRRGVLVGIGHTDASVDLIHAAVKAGAVLSTHLGNGVADHLKRHPNLIWAQLADDRLIATFIADGHHLPADTLKAMLTAKGVERSILVSDSVALAGLPYGRYKTAVGGEVEVSQDGRILIPGTRTLAGSSHPLRYGIANVARLPMFCLEKALVMATANPGKFVQARGVLRVGASADLVRFRWDPAQGEIELDSVVIMGVEQLGSAEN